MPSIFSENILSPYLSEFRLSSITDIRNKVLLLDSLIEELDSGKIDSMKEEEIKPHFINTFFGEILGFSYKNPSKWHLKLEKKSSIDGTKPDAVLGYFKTSGKSDDVRVVIEIKDAKTSLDEKQKRPSKRTTVDQAFDYVAKMGGACKWVVVSNIKETRFYHSLDRSRYQTFLLKDLADEPKLKELLYLFHKDRFIKETEKSYTDLLFERIKSVKQTEDKPVHIIDQLYNSLKRFEGFGFVDPNYICTIFPFNILKEHVWHYHDGKLFTLNNNICNLLKGIEVVNSEVIFGKEMQDEIISNVIIDAKHKMEWVFEFLNHCRIDHICAASNYKKIVEANKKTIGFTIRHSLQINNSSEGIVKNIWVINKNSCDCISCNFRTFDLNMFLSKIKTGLGNDNFNTREFAFGNYLAASNNFKTSYSIYKDIEKQSKGKEGKEIEYFLSKVNQKYLHNLVSDYSLPDGEAILNDIRSVDLDKVIFDEIEFSIDREVKNYLIAIRDDNLVYKIQDEIEETITAINKLRESYKNGGEQFAGPNLPGKLSHEYFLLYLHTNSNYIVYDIFKRYKALTTKVFRGLVESYQTPKWGLDLFSEFILTEAIVHIHPKELKEILTEVDILDTEEKCVSSLLQKLNNFTQSFFREGLFKDALPNVLLQEQLVNLRFEQRLTDIFTNLFIVLTKLNISKEQFAKSIGNILKFLKIEDLLNWYNLAELENFLYHKGYLFEIEDLEELLKIAINKNEYYSNKYKGLMKEIPNSIRRHYPEFKISNKKLIQTVILKCTSDDDKSSDFRIVVNLLKICDEPCKSTLIKCIEENLDRHFDAGLYEELLIKGVYSYEQNNYFRLYSEYINKHKGGSRVFKFGELKLTNAYFINYVFIIYNQMIDFNRSELRLVTNLNDFETWLLNPLTFDYSKFNAKWLIDINFPNVINRIKDITEIWASIENELKKEFHPVLAEIKYKLQNM